jgi:Ca2+-binding RTX toxin-like protein
LSSRTSFIGTDIEKIVLTNHTGSGSSLGGDTLRIQDQYASNKSWHWAGMAGYDDLYASNGNDTLDGGHHSDGLVGGNGNDALYGSLGFNDGMKDVLWGGAGNDYLNGHDGDILIGDQGSDVLIGGWAWYGDYSYVSVNNDRTSTYYNWTYASGSASYVVNLVDGTVTGDGSTDSLVGIYRVTTGSGNDTFLSSNLISAWFDAGAGNDVLYGAGGNDTMAGGAGFDVIFGSFGNDEIDGGLHLALLDYESLGIKLKIDLLSGTVDKVSGETVVGHDKVKNIGDVFGSSGWDEIIGSDVRNYIKGNDGNDGIDGAGGNDLIGGGNGNDYLQGGSGLDEIYGEAGDDFIDGGSGADTMYGGFGNDSYVRDDAGDQIVDNGGIDKVYTSSSYVLGAEIEHAEAIGGGNVDLTGNSLANELLGNGGKNVFTGGDGGDTMKGGKGDDVYYIDNLDDVVVEENLTQNGIDTVYVRVKGYDRRKITADIEHIFGQENLNDPPTKPVLVADTLKVINETFSGTEEVARVQATDVNGDPLTYLLTNHTDKFEIDAEGRIRMIAPFDFETAAGYEIDGGQMFYRVKVVAKETTFGLISDEAEVLIYIENTDEAPWFETYTWQDIFEDSPPGHVVTTAAEAYDPEGDAITFTLLDENGNLLGPSDLFTIDAQTGIISRGGASIPNIDSEVIRTLTVVATANGKSTQTQVQFKIQPVDNRAPEILGGPQSLEVDDNSTVAPFTGLTVHDLEDDSAVPPAQMTVSISWMQDAGTFTNLPNLSDPAYQGVSFAYTLGDHEMTILGTSAQIAAILHALRFNPKDRPQDFGTPNADQTIEFSVRLTDSSNQKFD